MSSFTTPLIAEKVSRKFWKLHEPFVYEVGGLGTGGICIQVPIGTLSDGASIPAVLWPVLGHPMEFKSAWVHDWIYRVGSINRRWCDDVLHEALLVEGVPEWKADTMWAGVRVGGWRPWNRYRKGANRP